MRKAIYIFLLAAAAPALWTACKKDGLITYNASNDIYFNYKSGVDPSKQQLGTLIDTVDYTFAYSPDNVRDTLFPIPIAITGAPANTDRIYKIVVDAGATAIEGKHYAWPPLVIKAGRVVDTLFMRFNRTADLRQGRVSMTLRLVPNENFSTDIQSRLGGYADTVNAILFKVSLSDMLVAGPDWNIYYASYFGTFSEKKMRLMNTVVGLPLNFWATSGGLNSAGIASAIYYATAMGRYLRQQAAAGNPIYEADGVTLMMMGANYQ